MGIAFLPTFRRDCQGFTAFATYALGSSAPARIFHQPYVSFLQACGKKRWLSCISGCANLRRLVFLPTFATLCYATCEALVVFATPCFLICFHGLDKPLRTAWSLSAAISSGQVPANSAVAIHLKVLLTLVQEPALQYKSSVCLQASRLPWRWTNQTICAACSSVCAARCGAGAIGALPSSRCFRVCRHSNSPSVPRVRVT
jgi:hypothetical protein